MAKYDSMTMDELKGIIRDATEALNRQVDARRQELISELNALGNYVAKPAAEKREATAMREGDGRAKPKVTHRDPATGATWASRGQKPRWLQVYIAEGRDPDDFRVTE
jgi:DNA-binding protein H-NS